jgi:hypothetical protein
MLKLKIRSLDWLASRICPDWNRGDPTVPLRVKSLRAPWLFPILQELLTYCTSSTVPLEVHRYISYINWALGHSILRCCWFPPLCICGFEKSVPLSSRIPMILIAERTYTARIYVWAWRRYGIYILGPVLVDQFQLPFRLSRRALMNCVCITGILWSKVFTR